MEAAFERAMDLPVANDEWFTAAEAIERPNVGLPDCFHEDIVGSEYSAAEIQMTYMGALPFRQRIAHWKAMRKRGEIQGVTANGRLLLPEWVKRTLKP